jgi:Telomeric repeat-binding factor 2.
MSKLIKIICLITVTSLVFLAGCTTVDIPKKNSETSQAAQSTAEEYTIGDTAVFKDIKITAEEIIKNEPEYLKADEGKKYIAVKFTIENISSEDQNVSSMIMFNSYSDGVKLDYSFGATSGLDGSLDGSISAGKKMIGYYGAEVDENAEKLEIEVNSGFLTVGKAVFTFDIPA